MRLKQAISKDRLLLSLLLLAVVPWQRGGRDVLGPMLILSALLLAWFWLWRRPAQPKFNLSLPILAGGGFIGWAWLSLAWSVSPYHTASFGLVWGLGALAFTLSYLALQEAPLRRWWLEGFIWLAMLVSLAGIWIYLTEDYERLTSWFYWANPLAAYLLPAILLALRQALGARRWWQFAPSVVILAAFWLSDSRSGWLVLLATGLLGAAFFRLNKAKSIKIVLILACSWLLALGLGQVRQLFSRVPVVAPGSRFEEALSGEAQSGSDRLQYLQRTGDIWRLHKLAGSGAGSFGSLHPSYQQRVVSAATDPHSTYAQAAAELGLVGLVLLLVAAIGTVLAAWWAWWRHKLPLAVAIATTALWLHLGLDIDASFPVMVVLIAIFSGLSWGSLATKPISKRFWLVASLVWLLLAAGLSFQYRSRSWAARGQAAQEAGEYARAATDYARATSGPIYDPDYLTSQGINYYTLALAGVGKEQNLERAGELALAASRQDPYDAQHHFLLARVARAQGRTPEALRHYRRSLELDPLNHPQYYLDLAYVLRRSGHQDQARTMLDKVLGLYSDGVILNRQADTSLRPVVSSLYQLRAELQLPSNPAAAKADFAKAVAVYPQNQAARIQLEQLP